MTKEVTKIGQSHQTIKSRLFGPHTKAMNASEYEIASSLLEYNTLVLPLFNTYSSGDVLTSLEQSSIVTTARVDDDFRDGYIIPFDTVNLHLPVKGYKALRHVGRPDLFFVKNNVVMPIDIKNSVRSEDNLRQISCDTMTHIFSHSDYFSKALGTVMSATGTSLDELVFADGFSLAMVAAQKEDSFWDFLEKNDDKRTLASYVDSPLCFSEEANFLFDIFLDKGTRYNGTLSAVDVQKTIGDLHTLIHNFGAAPASVLVVDGFDKSLRPSFRFSYVRNSASPVSVFPTDTVLAKTARDMYVDRFYSNPKEIDYELEKLFLPARLRHKKIDIINSIERKEHRIGTITNMISLSDQNYKTELRQKHNADALLKLRKLEREIVVKREELAALNNTYHKSSLEFEKQKELYAKHNKLAWVKYFGSIFEKSMDRFNEEIRNKESKFEARKESALHLNKKFSDYTSAQPFALHRSPNLAKLYLSVDRGNTYHAFSLSEKRLLSTLK